MDLPIIYERHTQGSRGERERERERETETETETEKRDRERSVRELGIRDQYTGKEPKRKGKRKNTFFKA